MIRPALFLGRFQPLHDGHAAIIEQLLREGKFVVVGVMDTPLDADNPYTMDERIKMVRDRFQNRVFVQPMPWVSEVVYGRNVGYGIREMKMGEEIEAISATEIRNKGGV